MRQNEDGEVASDDEGIDPDAMTYEELTELGETIGKQIVGLPQHVIDALPKKTYNKTAASAAVAAPGTSGKKDAHGDAIAGGQAAVENENEEEEEEQCAVCRMEFDDGDVVQCLPACGHVYHPDCLAPWLAENKNCPICKTEIDATAA